LADLGYIDICTLTNGYGFLEGHATVFKIVNAQDGILTSQNIEEQLQLAKEKVESAKSAGAYGQPPSGFNWLEACRNALVDPLITEPCESLTSPDGSQLTDEGRKVLICLGGGALGKLMGLSDADFQSLAPLGGCSTVNPTPQTTSPVTPTPPCK
jgi:hypothetical protein